MTVARNGHLPAKALDPIAGGGMLEPHAAAAWNALAAYVFDKRGYRIAPNGPDSSYRSFDRQVYWRNWWCARGACENAAIPGTSNHGLGLAVDTDDQGYIAEYGADFGWQKSWSDAPAEPWHFRYQAGHYNGPNPGPDYKTTDPVVKSLHRKIDAARKARGRKTKRLNAIRRQIERITGRVKRWRNRIARRRKS